MIFCDANTRELRRAESSRRERELASFTDVTCYAISSAKMPDARRNRRNARECLVESLGCLRSCKSHQKTRNSSLYRTLGSIASGFHCQIELSKTFNTYFRKILYNYHN